MEVTARDAAFLGKHHSHLKSVKKKKKQLTKIVRQCFFNYWYTELIT